MSGLPLVCKGNLILESDIDLVCLSSDHFTFMEIKLKIGHDKDSKIQTLIKTNNISHLRMTRCPRQHLSIGLSQLILVPHVDFYFRLSSNFLQLLCLECLLDFSTITCVLELTYLILKFSVWIGSEEHFPKFWQHLKIIRQK